MAASPVSSIDCMYKSSFHCIPGNNPKIEKIPKYCNYDDGIQCDQQSGNIKRRLVSSSDGANCFNEIFQKCPQCEWKKQCNSRKFIEEIAQDTEMTKCYYGIDNVKKYTDMPCNDHRCQNQQLFLFSPEGVLNGVFDNKGKQKACTLQCNAKLKKNEITVESDGTKKSTVIKTQQSC